MPKKLKGVDQAKYTVLYVSILDSLHERLASIGDDGVVNKQ